MLVPNFGRCKVGDAYFHWNVCALELNHSGVNNAEGCSLGLLFRAARIGVYASRKPSLQLRRSCWILRLVKAGFCGMIWDDHGWPMPALQRMKEETSILYHIINISTHIICNFVNLMALYWQQRDHLVELQASIWKPRVPLGRCWFLRWGQWELPVEGKDARGIFGK